MSLFLVCGSIAMPPPACTPPLLRRPTDEELQQMIDEVDTDRNGTIECVPF